MKYFVIWKRSLNGNDFINSDLNIQYPVLHEKDFFQDLYLR